MIQIHDEKVTSSSITIRTKFKPKIKKTALFNNSCTKEKRGEIDYSSTIINFLFAAIGGALFGAIVAFIAIFFRQAII